MDNVSYMQWRRQKLDDYPRNIEALVVDIGGLNRLSAGEKDMIIDKCRRYNMAIYRCADPAVDRAAIRAFAANFGLNRPDYHLCANDDGVSELCVASVGTRAAYVPYSNRSLSWHTDGYYNLQSRRVRAVVLHCEADAASGGENALLDTDIMYIRLRDENPDFITAFEHPECMTIPANRDSLGEIRPEVTGPVLSYGSGGSIHMRYSARKRNIKWREDDMTNAARECMSSVLGDKNGPVLHYRLKPGEGLISNNVLHNRTAFEDGEKSPRKLYRARFFDRIKTL